MIYLLATRFDNLGNGHVTDHVIAKSWLKEVEDVDTEKIKPFFNSFSGRNQNESRW